MNRNINWGKAVLSILICTILVLFCVKSHPYKIVGRIFETFEQSFGQEETGEMTKAEDEITMEVVKSEFIDTLWMKNALINLNGAMARSLNMKGYYSDLGIYVTDDQYIVGKYPAATTDYEFDQMRSFKQYLDDSDINLLYVNAPTKYVDDDLMMKEFGMESYSNQNADLFISRISEAGISCVDLRKELAEDDMNIYDMFYRTDHHWTTGSGLWAAGTVAEALNQYCGYQIDFELYQESNYAFTEYQDCWLGEQGRKLAVSYVGLDDFTVITPEFDTSLSVTTVNGTYEGAFDILLNQNCYNLETDVYSSPSWHYSYLYQGMNQSKIHNNNVDYGNVLVLGDSYSQVVIPFLSLGVSDITTLVLRSYDGSLKEYIEANQFDTVVILYAQFMIGAHDNPASANYDMFTFD